MKHWSKYNIKLQVNQVIWNKVSHYCLNASKSLRVCVSDLLLGSSRKICFSNGNYRKSLFGKWGRKDWRMKVSCKNIFPHQFYSSAYRSGCWVQTCCSEADCDCKAHWGNVIVILDCINKMININTLTFDNSNINSSTSRQSARLFKMYKKSNAAMNTVWVSTVCRGWQASDLNI